MTLKISRETSIYESPEGHRGWITVDRDVYRKAIAFSASFDNDEVRRFDTQKQAVEYLDAAYRLVSVPDRTQPSEG